MGCGGVDFEGHFVFFFIDGFVWVGVFGLEVGGVGVMQLVILR